jgi:quercetin dioxygenase-like cupin family protein
MTTYTDLASMPLTRIWEGVHGRVVQGERLTMAVVELEPGGVLPEHSHHQEQMGVVLVGSMTFTIGGETRELHPGETYWIPSGVPHSGSVGVEGATVVDVFSPTRVDWDGLPQLPPRRPRWPSTT